MSILSQFHVKYKTTTSTYTVISSSSHDESGLRVALLNVYHIYTLNTQPIIGQGSLHYLFSLEKEHHVKQLKIGHIGTINTMKAFSTNHFQNKYCTFCKSISVGMCLLRPPLLKSASARWFSWCLPCSLYSLTVCKSSGPPWSVRAPPHHYPGHKNRLK